MIAFVLSLVLAVAAGTARIVPAGELPAGVVIRVEWTCGAPIWPDVETCWIAIDGDARTVETGP